MLRILVTVGLAVSILAAPRAQAVVIDDFTVGAITLEDKTPGGAYTTATQTGLDTAHVAGGIRALSFNSRQQTGSTSAPDAAVRMSVVTDPTPHYAYAADQFLTAVNFTLRYDAQNAGGVNLDGTTNKDDLTILRNGFSPPTPSLAAAIAYRKRS